MSVPYGSKMHLPPTNYHLLATQQEPHTKNPSLNEKCWEKFLENKAHLLTKKFGIIFWRKKSQENGPQAENDKTERARGQRRKTRE